MDDLVTFLRAQIDEDERVALAAEDSCWHVEYCDDGMAGFHYRHDPARVLAEVAAKRAIVDLHPHMRFVHHADEDNPRFPDEAKPAFPGTDKPYVGCSVCNWDCRMEEVYADWWCPTLRHLAAVYADRDGYRPEWAPNPSG